MRLLRADRDALEQAIEESWNTAADDHDDELSAVGGAEEEEGQEGQEDDGDGELDAQEAIEAEAEAEAGEKKRARKTHSGGGSDGSTRVLSRYHSKFAVDMSRERHKSRCRGSSRCSCCCT
jgi:hypothetical protein